MDNIWQILQGHKQEGQWVNWEEWAQRFCGQDADIYTLITGIAAPAIIHALISLNKHNYKDKKLDDSY